MTPHVNQICKDVMVCVKGVAELCRGVITDAWSHVDLQVDRR